MDCNDVMPPRWWSEALLLLLGITATGVMCGFVFWIAWRTFRFLELLGG